MSPLAAAALRAAAVTVLIWLAAQAGHTVLLCAGHQAWARVHSGRSTMVLEQSERIAGSTDAIFVCETVHRTGPIVWHMDLECDCAPATVSAAQVGRVLAASCVVDKPRPQPWDDWGACRYGRCSSQLRWSGTNLVERP